MALTRLNHRRSLLPLVLLLVFDRKSVAHHDKISVLVCVLQSYTQDVAEGIQTGSSIALVVDDFQGCPVIENLEEVQSLDDASDRFLLKHCIASVVPIVGPAEDSLD